MGTEKRFKTWTYYRNTVYHFVGYYLNPTYVEFEDDEVVSTISTPKPSAWQFVPSGNRLFLKPVENEADTTATVMTNKRVYFFELHAVEAKGPFDPDLTFFVQFRYPQVTKADGDDDTSVIQYAASILPDLSHPEKYNFNYTMSGDDVIAPTKVFDDDNFTYMHFSGSNPTLPAVFIVDSEGFEEVSNFRIVGDYMIIEKVNSIYTLRYGAATVCIFNENKPYQSLKASR